MSPLLKRHLPLLICVLAVPTCALIMKPWVELGIDDESGYVHTAMVFAATRHILYSGLVTPMLLWQVVLAAPFVWLFGPTFTAVRLTVVTIAIATAGLMQRSYVRAGLTEWNAAFGTLVIMLSPLTLPLAFHFMSDMPGFFAIVLCFYCCLRAVQSTSRYGHLLWIAIAAVSNVIGGSGRQIAWLGVLVMVPATAWVLRKKEKTIAFTAVIYTFSFAAILLFLRWFKRQPYTLLDAPITSAHLHDLGHMCFSVVRCILDLGVFLLPVLVGFIVKARFRNVRTWALIIAGAALVLAPMVLHHPHFFAPFLGNDVTEHGVIDGTPIRGERPVILPMALRIFFSIASAVGILVFLRWLSETRTVASQRPSQNAVLSWRDLSWIVGPVVVAYLLFLLPRGAIAMIYDRYLITLTMFGAVVLLRLYQERISVRMPAVMIVTACLFSAYAIAATHDVFSMFRARAQADNMLLATGLTREQIDGGYEWNAWTETVNHHSLHSTYVPLPAGMTAANLPSSYCHFFGDTLFADVNGLYTISFNPKDCGGVSSFPPVVYKEWLGPHSVPIYILKVLPSEQVK